jgi:hypothetical protein
MTATEKYKKIFGKIESLSDEISWTTGLSNMLEWLLWDTKNILGVSKKAFWKQIVQWCEDPEIKDLEIEEKYKIIEKKLTSLLKENEQPERYSKTSYKIYSAREGLRQAKYFSEDYLNKEFDIFLNLVSNSYLDKLYGDILNFNSGGTWSTHGQSGLFETSTRIDKMQIDNVAYNSEMKILVANELKLGGHKNKDQILKYGFMFNTLVDKKFIAANSQFLLLFITDKDEKIDLIEEIEKEISFCKTQPNKAFLLDERVISTAKNSNGTSISWLEIIKFNERYLDSLQQNQEVERKLLEGFNFSLKQKKFMQ